MASRRLGGVEGEFSRVDFVASISVRMHCVARQRLCQFTEPRIFGVNADRGLVAGPYFYRISSPPKNKKLSNVSVQHDSFHGQLWLTERPCRTQGLLLSIKYSGQVTPLTVNLHGLQKLSGLQRVEKDDV